MTLEEFRKYYRNNKGLISSVKAYDASGGKWVGPEDLLQGMGAYTLIVVKFKNRTFLRVSVKPSLKVSYSHRIYASAGTWKGFGINLTYEEKEFLNGLGDQDLSIDDLISIAEASSFEGRHGLVKKLKRVAESI
ncbi:MAG: hypothetical protein ACM3QV_00250 [Caulobacteraceae bacterium]